MADHRSQDIVVEAPMSFTGATKRIWKLTRLEEGWVKYLILVPMALTALFFAYAAILAWYAMFGILLIPYRLIRRSQRNGRRQAAMHRELLNELQNKKA